MKYPTFHRTMRVDGLEAPGLHRYILYMQDYGGPVGFRMALAHPERIQGLIVQDALDTAPDEVAVLVRNFASNAASGER